LARASTGVYFGRQQVASFSGPDPKFLPMQTLTSPALLQISKGKVPITLKSAVGVAVGLAVTIVAALRACPWLYYSLVMRLHGHPQFEDGTWVQPSVPPQFPLGHVGYLASVTLSKFCTASLQISAKMKGYLMNLYVGKPCLVIARNTAAVKDVLGPKITMSADREIPLPTWKRLFGKGLFMVGASEWKKQRKICLRAFGTKPMQKFTAMTESCVASLFEDLERSLSGRSVKGQASESLGLNTTEEGSSEWAPGVFFKTMAISVITTVAFGQDVHADELTTVRQGFGLWESTAEEPLYAVPGFLDTPLSGPQHVRSAIEELHRVARKFIQQERDCGCVQDKSEMQSLLSVLVHARDEKNGQLSEEELVSNVYAFLGAGIGTTSHSLSSAMFLLAQHPDVQSRLHVELSAGPLDWSFVKGAPYLSAVIAETLRLVPPFIALPPRTVRNDTVLPGGLHVGAGTTIEVNPLTHQRDPAVWGADAEEWRPERWLEGQGEDQGLRDGMRPHKPPGGIEETSFLAFGGGVRPCIGMPLAMIEMKMALAHAVRRFEFAEVQPDRFKMVFSVPFIFPKHGLKLKLRRRSEHL